MLGVRSSPSVQGEPVSAAGGGGGLPGRGGGQAGRRGGQAGRGGGQAGRGGRQMSGVGRVRGYNAGRGGDGQGGTGDRRPEAAGVDQGVSLQVGRGVDEQGARGPGGRQHGAAGVGRGRGLQIGRGASGPEERLSVEEILRPGDRRHEAAGVGQVEVHQVGRAGDTPAAVIEGFSQVAGPARAAGGDPLGGCGVGRGASGPEERLSAEEILRPGDRRHVAAGVGRGRGRGDRQREAGGLAGRGRGGGGREERAVRARAWRFTINNYREVPMALPSNARYLCFGREVSSTGTKHLQGYVVFKYAVKQPSRFFQNCGGGNFEVAKGSADENVEYCSKEGDFVEYGDRPQSPRDQGHHGSKGEKHGEKGGAIGGAIEVKRWEDAWNSAKDGKIEDIPGDIRVRYYSTFTKVAAKYAKPPPELDNLDNTWIFGPSGTGKSLYIHRKYPGGFKKEFSKWWDGYQEDNEAHQTVLLDDLHPKWAEKERLKNWADHYPFVAEIKGGSMLIRPARIVVTSNYHPREVATEMILMIMQHF